MQREAYGYDEDEADNGDNGYMSAVDDMSVSGCAARRRSAAPTSSHLLCISFRLRPWRCVRPRSAEAFFA